MQINKVVESENGQVSITGNLSENEANIVFTLGLNLLLGQGLMAELVPSLDVSEIPEKGDMQ